MKHIRYLLGFIILITANVSLMAQNNILSGRICNQTGDPLAGAIIVVKGSSTGVSADIDGKFKIEGLELGDILVFSYMLSQKEVIYEGQDSLDITLVEDNQVLEESVVVGYGQVRRGDLTGAVTSFNVDDKKRAFTPRVQDMLVGKVAGVTVIDEGGAPNGNSFIRIRGGSSLSASNEPLIIIDGIYVDSQGINGAGNILNSINSNDIASFTLLKDASATAIYGSRASNGVILITTKKGQAGKLKFTYDGNISVGFLPKTIDVLTGDEYRVFLKEYYSETPLYAQMKERQGLVNTDWQKEIYQTTINTEHNIGLSGAVAEILPFRVSLGYSKQDGILKTSRNERMTANISLSPSFFDNHLKIDATGLGMVAKNRFADWSAIGAAIAMDPTQAVYDKDSPYGGYFAWLGSDRKVIQVATPNPVSRLNMLHDNAIVYNFKGSATMDYTAHFLPGLHLNVSGSIDASNSNGRKYYDPWMASDYMYGGYDSNWTQRIRNSQFTAYLKYGYDSKVLNFDVMAGYEWQKYMREGHSTGYRIKQYDKFGNPLLVEDHGYKNEHYLISFFGRANLSVLDKYLLTFTLRDDGSSRFSAKNRWAIFPSVALAWKISEEPFMKNIPEMSNLKLRVGWGITGQQEINIDYGHLRTYLHSTGTEVGYIRGYNGTDPIWSELLRPESYNPDLKWESTTTYNAGLDYGFFKGRLNGSIDYYYRVTDDLINVQTRTVAGTNFKEYVPTNIGSLVNTGLELSIDYTLVSVRDFSWNTSLNFAYNKNIITRLASGDDSNVRLQDRVMVNMVGYPANSYYVYEQIYDHNGKPIEGLYRDRNGDGIINTDDLRPYKNVSPSYTLGLNTSFVWKDFDFSIAGHGNFDVYNYNAVAAGNASLSPTSVFVSETLVNRVQSAFDTNFSIAQPLSDYYVQNASFFKVDNIILGWSFNSMPKSKIGGRVFLNVQNPFVITGYKGMDPEVFGGYDGTLYPRPVTVLLGVTLNI